MRKHVKIKGQSPSVLFHLNTPPRSVKLENSRTCVWARGEGGGRRQKQGRVAASEWVGKLG